MDDALAARFEGFEGASPEAIARIEETFGRKLPAPLREILLEAQPGVMVGFRNTARN